MLRGLGFLIPIFVISEIRVMGLVSTPFLHFRLVRRLSPSRIRLRGLPSSVFSISEIRELDPPNLPFSYFTQIGVLWAGECVFSISGFFKVFAAHGAKIWHWDGVTLQRITDLHLCEIWISLISLVMRKYHFSRKMLIFASGTRIFYILDLRKTES